MITPSDRRSGAALILALIILASLLLLGLPFLFTQSASMASTRRFEAASAARIYESSVHGLGIALAEQVSRRRFDTTLTDQAASIYSLPEKSSAWNLAFPSDSGRNGLRVDVSTIAPALTSGSATADPVLRAETGLTLSDESGRLDANSLGPYAWSKLLGATFDPDEDPALPIPGYQSGDYDEDTIGQLAQGLAAHHLVRPYRGLEDLLAVQPLYKTVGRRTVTPSTPWPLQLRGPLNRSEIEQLRSKLSFSRQSDGRDGLVEIGSLAAVIREANFSLDVTDSPLQPDIFHPLAPIDAEIIGESDNPADPPVHGWMMSTGPSTNPVAKLAWMESSTQPVFSIGNGRFRRLGATINLNGINRSIPDAFNALPAPLPGAWFQTAEDAGTLLNWQPSYLANSLWYDRSPIDLYGEPLFRIFSASAIFDRSNTLAAQRRREVVAQVVPDQQALAFQWKSQADFETALLHRFSNRIATWPHGIERSTDLSLDSNTNEAGATASTLPTEGDTTANGTDVIASTDLGLTIGWHAPFGRGKSQPQSQLLHGFSTPTTSGTVGGVVDLGNLPVAAQDLTPEGWTIEPGKGIAWQVGAGGPLTTRNSISPDMHGYEMAPAYLGFWVQILGNSNPGQLITLADLTVSPKNVGSPIAELSADGTTNTIAGDARRQNNLSLIYDQSAKTLILSYSPPSIEPPPNPPFQWGSGDTNVDIDGRSGGGSLLPRRKDYLPPALVTNRIASMTYAGPEGLVRGRWHHILIAIGSGTIGGLSVHLDHCVGRDVTRITNGYTPQTGDRCFWPALVLTQPLDVLVDALGKKHFDNELVSGTITAAAPAFLSQVVGATPTLDQFTTAPCGTIRIGDEYIRYDSTSAWQFTQCHRGVRQNTQTNDPLVDHQWPTTQAHTIGSIIIPGSFRADLNQTNRTSLPPPNGSLPVTGRLYAGGCTLRDEFAELAPEDVILPPSPAFSISLPGAVTLATAPVNWPMSGIVRLQNTAAPASRYALAYFEKNGSSLALRPIKATETTTDPTTETDWHIRGSRNEFMQTTISWTSGERIVAINCGMAVNNDPTSVSPYPLYPYDCKTVVPDPTITHLYQQEIEQQVGGTEPTRLQLLDPATGTIEWITYTHLLHYTTNDPSIKRKDYFVNATGWGMNPSVTTSSPRGQQRTGVHASAWPDNSLVIPVQQEHLSAGQWLDAGDFVTLIPRKYTPAYPPLQCLVRYVAVDGYGSAGSTHETTNGLFAFAHFLSRTVLSADYPEIIVGEGLSAPTCLSPVAPYSSPIAPYFFPVAYLPRLDATYDDASSHIQNDTLIAHNPDATVGRLVIGGRDEDLNRNAGSPHSLSGYANRIPLRIDAPWSGFITHDREGLYQGTPLDPLGPITGATTPQVIALWDKSQNAISKMDGSPSSLPMYAWITTRAITPEPIATNPSPKINLIDIDGEVFASEAIDDPTTDQLLQKWKTGLNNKITAGPQTSNSSSRIVRLIGRGLLGTQTMAHQLGGSLAELEKQVVTGVQRHHGLPVDLVPIGPVRKIVGNEQLNNSVSGTDNDRWFSLTENALFSGGVSSWNPSASLLAVRVDDPTQSEIIGLCGGLTGIPDLPSSYKEKFTSAPWLRAAYGTSEVDWSVPAPNNLTHLAIGWWPRYPPPMPSPPSPASSRSQFEAAGMRSRHHPWVGLPARLRGFRPTAQPTVRIDPNLDHNLAAAPYMEILAGGMATSVDGNKEVDGTVKDPQGKFADWSRIFSHPATWDSSPTQYNAAPSGDILSTSWCSGTSVVDGLELRLTWRLNPTAIAGDLRNAARNGSITPRISNVTATGRAPSMTLSIEDLQ